MVVLARDEVLAGVDELAAAERLGRLLGHNGLTLGYAGGTSGAAGALADAALRAGGQVIGVTRAGGPLHLVHPNLTEHRSAVDHEAQRAELARLAEAFIALPAALDSLEAGFEIWDWAPGASAKPLGLFDAGRYYSTLLATADDQAMERFARESQRGVLVMSQSIEDLVRRLADFRPPETRRTDSPDPD